MKKITTITFFSFAIVLFLVGFTIFNSFSYIFPAIDNNNQTLTIEEDRLKSTLYRFSPNYYYLPGINSYNDIVAKQGAGLLNTREIDGGVDSTLFIKLNTNVDQLTFVINDFPIGVRVFVDDHQVASLTNAKRHILELSNLKNSSYLIFQFKASDVGNIFIPTLYIGNADYINNFFLIVDMLELTIIGILILSCAIALIMTIFQKKKKKIIYLIICAILASFILYLLITNNIDYSYKNINIIFHPFKMLFLAGFNSLILYDYFSKREELDDSRLIIPPKMMFILYILAQLLVVLSIFIHQIYVFAVLYLFVYTFSIFMLKKINKYNMVFFSSMIITIISLFRDSLKSFYYVVAIFDDFVFALTAFSLSIIIALEIKFFLENREEIRVAIRKEEKKFSIAARSNEELSRIKNQYEELSNAYSRLQSMQENNQNLLLNISHDLRTPLSIIEGYLQVLHSESSQVTKEHYFTRINAKLTYLKKLINDLFLVTKMEEGNFQLTFEEIEIVAFTNNLIGDYQIMAEDKGLTYITSLTKGFLIKQIDSKQYPRIIENIITNAIKYNKRGGSIIIETSIIEIDGNHRFRVKVEDSGIGIDDKDLPRIFGSYYLEKRRSNQNDSSGVGLFITKQLVDRHKAKIWVESVKEKGTKFFFEI